MRKWDSLLAQDDDSLRRGLRVLHSGSVEPQNPIVVKETLASHAALAMLSALSVEERAAVHLVYTGHPRENIAGILQVPCQCVDTVLTRARTAMRHCVRE